MHNHNNVVADDYNEKLNVIIFSDRYDYQRYSSFLFGNRTDNGGIYLEGNPDSLDNKAMLIVYNDNENGVILNLEHEYTHYLDGRYNLKGSFIENLSHGYIVWWLEGFAEYLHYGNNYFQAIELTSIENLPLSHIFSTSYNDDKK